MSLHTSELNSIRYAERQEIARWKTKAIQIPEGFPEYVIMENFDAIGAQDGWKTDHIEWKAKASTTITANVFEYLESKWIDTHFHEKLSDTEILVDNCDMVPLECVFRFVTTGSHYRREKHSNPNVQADGTILDTPIMEFFYKHDVYVWEKRIADPLMQCKDGIPELDADGNFILLYPSTGKKIEYTDVYHAGTKVALTDEEREKDKKTIWKYAEDIQLQTVEVGEKLQEFYIQEGIEVLDGKIEFWVDTQWKLKVADVIDADSCRLRKPLIWEDSDGNKYLGEWFSKDDVRKSLKTKYFTPIENLFSFVWLIWGEEAPYTETLAVIEKFCISEPGKYKDDLKEFLDADGNIDFSAFKTQVIQDGSFRWTRKITKQLLQDIARKKALELEWNYGLKWIFERNENGKIVFKRDRVFKAWGILEGDISQLGKPQKDTTVYTRIVEWEWFDKQGYREGEELDTTKSKYEKLAEVTQNLLKFFWIGSVREWVAGKIVKTLQS